MKSHTSHNISLTAPRSEKRLAGKQIQRTHPHRLTAPRPAPGGALSPVYGILILCRVLSYLETGEILSKREAGIWAYSIIPENLVYIVRSAVEYMKVLTLYFIEKLSSISKKSRASHNNVFTWRIG